jgi:hypothetical protein
VAFAGAPAGGAPNADAPQPIMPGDAINVVLSYSSNLRDPSQACSSGDAIYDFEAQTGILQWSVCVNGELISSSHVLKPGPETAVVFDALDRLTTTKPLAGCGVSGSPPVPGNDGHAPSFILERSDVTVTSLSGSQSYVDSFFACMTQLQGTPVVDGLQEARTLFEYISSIYTNGGLDASPSK